MMHRLAPTVSRHEITENELAWVEFLRTLSHNEDPRPSLDAIQALRAILEQQQGMLPVLP